MARKTVSRKELRAEHEAAEKAGVKKKKTAKKAAKKTTRTRKKKSAKAEDVPMKAFWGVFSQSLKRVAVYEYSQRKAAEKKAAELSASGSKAPHFVQLVKEPVVAD